MTRDIRTITPDASATEARSAMRTAGVRHLVVVDKGDLVGIVSDRDLGGQQPATGRAGLTVANLMTSTVVTAQPETTIRQAANLLRGHVIGCLVIVEDEQAPRHRDDDGSSGAARPRRGAPDRAFDPVDAAGAGRTRGGPHGAPRTSGVSHASLANLPRGQ